MVVVVGGVVVVVIVRIAGVALVGLVVVVVVVFAVLQMIMLSDLAYHMISVVLLTPLMHSVKNIAIITIT